MPRKLKITSYVSRLGTDLDLPADFDEREAYRKHLEEKHGFSTDFPTKKEHVTVAEDEKEPFKQRLKDDLREALHEMHEMDEGRAKTYTMEELYTELEEE